MKAIQRLRACAEVGNRASSGFGSGMATETSPFNLENDRELRENLAFGVLYYYNLGSTFAVGLHAYGYFDTIEDYRAPLEEGVLISDIDISTTEVGPRMRLTFTRGRLFPYVYGGASYFTAKVRTSPLISEVSLSGYTWLAGAGMGWRAGKNFAISIEGMYTQGEAEFNLRPVEESADNSFNPAALYGLILLSWLPGEFED